MSPESKKLTNKEVETLFLDLWWELSPPTYESFYVDDIQGDLMISNCAAVYPKLYRKLLFKLEEEAARKGFILP